MVNAHGVFSANVAHKTISPKTGARQVDVCPSKKTHTDFPSVSVARMANNHLPSCTFSQTECLQWWAFTPVKWHPLQDVGPEMGVGACPRVGLYTELYSNTST